MKQKTASKILLLLLFLPTVYLITLLLFRGDVARLFADVQVIQALFLITLFAYVILAYAYLLHRRAEKRYRATEQVHSLEAAQRLRIAIEASHAGAWEIKIKERMLFFDEAFRQMFDLPEGTDRMSLDEWDTLLRTKFEGIDLMKTMPIRTLKGEMDTTIYVAALNKYLRYFSKPVYDDSGNVISRIGLTMDVTGHQRDIKQMHTYEKTLSVALQSANAGLWYIPLNQNEYGEYIVHFDDHFAKLFHTGNMRSCSTAVWSQFLRPIIKVNDSEEETEQLHQFFLHFGLQSPSISNNAVLRFASGQETYIQYTSRLTNDEFGNPDRMIGLTIDLTDRTQALETAHKLSQTLLNSMQQMIYVADIDTDEVLFINDVMLAAFHVPQDYKGKKYWELFRQCSVESVQNAKALLDRDPTQIVRWEIYQPYLEKELTCMARYISWVDGKTVCFRTYFDQTNIKRAERAIEEQLRQQHLMADLARNFISMTDVDDTLMQSIRSIGEFLDCYRVVLLLFVNNDTKGDDMYNAYEWYNVRKGAMERQTVVLPFSSTRYVRNALIDNNEPFIIINAKDTKHFPHYAQDPNLETLLFVPFYVDGEMFGMLEFMHCDIEHIWQENEIQLALMVTGTYAAYFSRQRISENLVHALQAAESANTAKSAFLSNMSHEIRTPLNAIIGMTNIAMKQPLPEQAQRSLQIVQSASDVLMDIINNVLDMSKIEAAKLELTNDYFNLNELLDNLYNVVSVRAHEKHQQITFEVDEKVPSAFYGDSLRLTQVMTNIIYNAIKFSSEHTHIRATITLQALHDNHATLLITIADQGMGMTDAQVKRLFLPFEQGDQRTVRRFGGTGLGLAITKEIVSLMGGSIDVHSELGVGSTFEVTLSLLLADAPIIAPNVPTQAHTDLSNKCILLAEDIEINREIVCALLQPTGVKIDQAENGEIAVSLFRASPKRYSLILMDIQMPELDGYGATRIIRQMDTQIPIVAMTAHAFKEDEEKSISAGMNDHIIKPINESTLLGAVYRYIS